MGDRGAVHQRDGVVRARGGDGVRVGGGVGDGVELDLLAHALRDAEGHQHHHHQQQHVEAGENQRLAAPPAPSSPLSAIVTQARGRPRTSCGRGVCGM